ncbi:MAG TPA: hypothetical protein VFQ78_01205 [Candidatus Udaeobacter sp.]|jgi:hypothetical protein|nr:hypothetical protein [Candidatus Udaeobacter sp.]
MKKYSSIIHILSLACAGIILIGCGTTQPGAATAPPPNSGRLMVNRVANFGSGLVLVLSVDGKDVATLTEGRNYSGYLSAGQHRLTARIDPYQAGTSPMQKTVTIKAGQTYSYTASWSGQKVVFVKNQ